MSMGAKKKLGMMQGRGVDECFLCHDDVCVSRCIGCDEIICKDCKMDHDCINEDIPPKTQKKQN